MMRGLIILIAVCLFVPVSVARAENLDRPATYGDIGNLMKRLEKVEKDQQKILQNQDQIFEELQVIKVRIRRGG